jgi:hypothetical protein
MRLVGLFSELEKLAVPAVVRRVLTGAGVGALGGLGYHGLKERTPDVQPAAWAQALDNEAPDLKRGDLFEQVNKVLPKHGLPEGKLVSRRGSAVFAEIPLRDTDAAGRTANMAVVGDVSRGDFEKYIRETASKFGRSIDETKFDQKVRPALATALKPWWRR